MWLGDHQHIFFVAVAASVAVSVNLRSKSEFNSPIVDADSSRVGRIEKDEERNRAFAPASL